MTMTGGYISPEGAEALRNYQYKGSDLSLSYKYVLSPLAEKMVQNFVPLWMAPNLVTLLGLLFPISSLALFMYYSNDMKTTPPSWTLLYNAFTLFAYQTLDNMDGKQARRTKTSSALGMIFDHGCDAINAGVGAMNFITLMGIRLDDPVAVLVSMATPFVPFFVATWEEYYIGDLVLPIINGPSEGVLVGVTLSIISYLKGPAYFQETGYYKIVLFLSFLSVSMTIAMQLFNTIRYQWKRSASVIRALADLAPFTVLCLGTVLTVVHAQEFFTAHPRLVIGTVSVLFVEMVVQLMVAHMAHQEYQPFNRIMLVPFALCVYLSVSKVETHDNQLMFWTFQLLIASFFTSSYLIALIIELCTILGINCLSIPYKHLYDHHGQPAVPGAVNGMTKKVQKAA